MKSPVSVLLGLERRLLTAGSLAASGQVPRHEMAELLLDLAADVAEARAKLVDFQRRTHSHTRRTK
jgi:hypothetical protein